MAGVPHGVRVAWIKQVHPYLNCGFSSGAPPVRSRVRTLAALPASRCRQRSAVRRSIASVRSGELSTWQWEHAWLQ